MSTAGIGGKPERLSALDAAFLHIEREGLPIHVASVATFEAGPLLDEQGRFRLEDIRAQVAARLDALPRLRRKVAWPRWGVARPCWIDDEDFDVAHHVDMVALPRGSDSDELRRLAEALVAERLPVDRPLWHLRFVTGLDGDRVGLVERVHHALVDGVSGVDVATVILDLSPDVQPPVATDWTPRQPPSAVSLALNGIRDQLRTPTRAMRSMAAAAVHPLRLARRGMAATTAAATMVVDGPLAPRSSLNVPVGAERRLGWTTVRLDEVKAAGRAHGATTNDVVLAAVGHGLRALLVSRGERVDPTDVLKVLVPVSLRDEDQHGTLGNQVGALLLPLPIGIADPVERLTAVAGTTARLKQRREATTSQLLLTAADLLPAPMVGPIARLTDVQRTVNLVVTNVPGPQFPLYCLGAKMLEAVPVVPLGRNLSVGVAILSYDGALTVSLTADVTSVPDLAILLAGIEEGFIALDSKVSASVGRS